MPKPANRRRTSIFAGSSRRTEPSTTRRSTPSRRKKSHGINSTRARHDRRMDPNRSGKGTRRMHKVVIPKSVVDRVVAHRGAEHIYRHFDPARTAFLVIDMQNAFMMPGVAHALCPTAVEVVPNINRIAK